MTDKAPVKVRMGGGPHVSQEMLDDITQRKDENKTSLGIEIERDWIDAKILKAFREKYKNLL